MTFVQHLCMLFCCLAFQSVKHVLTTEIVNTVAQTVAYIPPINIIVFRHYVERNTQLIMNYTISHLQYLNSL